MSERKRPGPKWLFDESLGKGLKKNPSLPEKVWPVFTADETKITLNEMTINQEFRSKIWEMGKEEREKRLSKKGFSE
jgi:hypothetical protein